MEWQFILLIIGCILFLTLLSGLPIFVAFLIVDTVGILLFMGGLAGIDALVRSIFDSIGVFTLCPVVLFTIMGEAIFRSGMASRALDVLERLMVRLPGRLSVVAVSAGAIFATLSGSALGACAMLGSLLVPDMEKRGYSKSLSMGPIMAGGMLAVIIPPSTLAVILGAQGGISVGKLLLAGFIPGFILAGLYLAHIIISCVRNPSLAPMGETTTAKTNLGKDFLKYVVPLAAIVLSVLGSIFTGIATPTEASALGALTSFILAACYRKVTLQMIIKSATGALAISTMILMIVGGSVAFSQLLSFTGIVRGIVELVTNLKLPPLIIVAIMQVLLIIMGCFMDQIAMIMIAVPIFMPITAAMGFDPIWMGLLMLVSISLGLLTPPFGLLLFIMKGNAPKGTTMMHVYRSSIPYLVLTFIGLALFILFPGIVTWLPQYM
ncbi:MAG: Sialic acid TRAP transporter permease protein SiaT [Syntrophorhabdus sp. PtaU1.Bin058]|nr:MAG: Sialic acid TRAP transporter permease protein SiaT [Syntrophorhabdus sp. PtaU1.Bin058]